MAARDDEIRIRPGRIRPGHRGAKRPSKLCRRGHARREEGWPYREGARPSGSKQLSIDLRARSPRRPRPVFAILRSARRHHGPRRAPSRPPVSRSAAGQARRLSQARRRDPRWQGRAPLRRGLGQRGWEGVRRALRGRPASFPVHCLARGRRSRWRTFAPSPGNS